MSMSVIRNQVLKVLKESKEPLSAPQIFNILKSKGVLKTIPPVYLALMELVSEGKAEMFKEYRGRKVVRKWKIKEPSQ